MINGLKGLVCDILMEKSKYTDKRMMGGMMVPAGKNVTGMIK